MNKTSAAELLKVHPQHITNKRVALLELLMRKAEAFSLSEIVKRLLIPVDRVTIYRTLQTFEAVGLVRKMVDSKGICLYMFNYKKHSTI